MDDDNPVIEKWICRKKKNKESITITIHSIEYVYSQVHPQHAQWSNDTMYSSERIIKEIVTLL